MLNLTESLGAEWGLGELAILEAREVSSGAGGVGGLVSRLVELLWLVELWTDGLLLESPCPSVEVEVDWFRKTVSAGELSGEDLSELVKEIRMRLS